MASKIDSKDYKFTTGDGQCTLRMRYKGFDGRVHSVTCEYPLRGDNGRKMSRKQTIEYLIDMIKPQYIKEEVK